MVASVRRGREGKGRPARPRQYAFAHGALVSPVRVDTNPVGAHRPARQSPPIELERATYGLCVFSLVGFGRTRPAWLLLTSDRAGYRELRVETGERYDTRAHRVAAQERSVGTFSTTGRLDRPSVKLGLASDPPTSMHASPQCGHAQVG